jgi:hypothetical protein
VKIALATTSLLLLALPAFAALSEEEVETLVRGEKTWTNRSGLTIKINQNELTIGTYREPGVTDKDMKIDSVMITRKIMETDPEIARVKIRFYDPVNRRNFQLVDVRQSDIKAFSKGLVDIDTLLTGVDIEKVSEAPEVVDGPFASERLQAKQHIEKLREQGVGVAVYSKLFGQVEDLAKDGEKNKEELRTLLDRLNKAFDEQAAFVRQQKEKAFSKQLELLNQARAAKQAQAATTATKTAQSTFQPPPPDIDPATGLERLGIFTPFPGPFLLDRIYVARKINQLRKNNSSVATLTPIWHRMEMAVRKKDNVTLQNDLDYLQKQLGLLPLTEEERNSQNVIKMHKP